MRLEFDDEAIGKLGRRAAQQAADRAQVVYDRVLSMGQGQPVEDVKAMLAQEWRGVFGGEIPEPKLSEQAALLSEGHRIETRAGGSGAR